MVHHEPAKVDGVVPEELYNLTQLANVTLAAGKLSTDIKSAFTPVRQSGSVHSLPFVYQPTPSRPVATCLSSDDDTTQHSYGSSGMAFTRNYAHKIFDKRKTRQQLLITTPIASTATVYHSHHQHVAADVESIAANEPDMLLNLSSSHAMTKQCSAQMESDEMHMMTVTSGDEEIEPNDSSFGDDLHGMVDEEEYGETADVTEGDDSDIHVCPECGKKYSTSSNLARHRQTHRSLMDKKARRCPHCDKVYVSMPAFSMHVRTHNQGCECPHCGKRFSRPWLLQGHIRTHTGEKPFECSICSKAFADKSNLRAHIQTHSNTKPHTCTRCGKSFALKSYLYKHEESSCVRNLNKSSTSSSSSSSSSESDKDKSSPRRLDSLTSSTSTASFAPTSPSTKSTAAATVTTFTTLTKVPKRGKSTTELQLKCREKLRDKLRGPSSKMKHSLSDVDTMQCNGVQNHRVTTDSGSQKSYIDLSHPSVTSVRDSMPYSRISVIRSVVSTNDQRRIAQTQCDTTTANPSCSQMCHDDEVVKQPEQQKSHLAMGFYQEIPMDYSPKTNHFKTNSASSFGITSKYAVIA